MSESERTTSAEYDPPVRENYQEDISVEKTDEEKNVDAEATKAGDDDDFDQMFAEDSDAPEEDEPTGQKATGSDEAIKSLYDPAVAKAAKEKAARHAMDAKGDETTAIVEQSTALEADGEAVQMDDLAWLEKSNFQF